MRDRAYTKSYSGEGRKVVEAVLVADEEKRHIYKKRHL